VVAAPSSSHVKVGLQRLQGGYPTLYLLPEIWLVISALRNMFLFKQNEISCAAHLAVNVP
jgi:hypothetical protein